MSFGPSLVIRGAILGCLVLTGFVMLMTSSLETAPVLAAEPLPPQPEVQQQEAQLEPVQQAGAEVPPFQTLSDCAVSSSFPPQVLQWCSLITLYASENSISPDLIAALIWQESGGNPTAYSKSGAVGLMQIMPSDGIAASFMCKNGPCFSSRPTIQELQDPEFNLAYGTHMLSGLVGRQGSLREALKAYGPMDVGYYYADKVLGIFDQYRQ